LAQELARNVDRNVRCGRDRAQQKWGLGAAPRAEFDDRAAGPDRGGEIGAMAFQDLGLGAGRIIFGQHGDRFEQPRAGLIVEPPRRDRLLALAQPGEHFLAERGVDPVGALGDDP
jgi:hypothetical protein